MELFLLLASLVLLALHVLALVWLWQIRRRMSTCVEPKGSEFMTPETPRGMQRDEAEQWFVSDAEQAQREREMIRASGQRATEGESWQRRR